MSKNIPTKKIFMILSTLLLVLIILFCTSETVMSRNKADNGSRRKYYAAMEKEYRSEMERLLDKKGYLNCGINLRWVSDGDGLRTYTVILHHRKLNMLDEYEKEELLRELSETEFLDESCTFCYEFLIV